MKTDNESLNIPSQVCIIVKTLFCEATEKYELKYFLCDTRIGMGNDRNFTIRLLLYHDYHNYITNNAYI